MCCEWGWRYLRRVAELCTVDYTMAAFIYSNTSSAVSEPIVPARSLYQKCTQASGLPELKQRCTPTHQHGPAVAAVHSTSNWKYNQFYRQYQINCFILMLYAPLGQSVFTVYSNKCVAARLFAPISSAFYFSIRIPKSRSFQTKQWN